MSNDSQNQGRYSHPTPGLPWPAENLLAAPQTSAEAVDGAQVHSGQEIVCLLGLDQEQVFRQPA